MNSFTSKIYDNYQEQIKSRKMKLMRVLSYMTLIFAGLTGLSLMIYHVSIVFMILFYVFLVIFGILVILWIMFNSFYVSERPLYETLYPQVIKDHNDEHHTMMTYHSYPSDKAFFEFGGFFSKYATKAIRFKLSFETKKGYHVDVYDTFVTISNGKTTHMLLNGYYLVFRDYGSLKFQLRTYGNPNSDLDYVKLSDIKDVRAFVEKTEIDLDLTYIHLYHQVKNEYESPSVVIGCNGCDLHLAITLKRMRRHVKVLTEETYQELRRSLVQMIDLANTIN